MAKKDKKRYWLWGELDAASNEILKKIQLSINEKLGGPIFDLHLHYQGLFMILTKIG